MGEPRPRRHLSIDLLKMVVKFGNYGNVSGLQWMRKEFGEDYDMWLRPLTNDNDIVNMVEAAKLHGNQVDIYVVHVVIDGVDVVIMSEQEIKELEEEILDAT